MHQCTGDDGCSGCRAEAAKLIDDWGSEGVHSAARIVGEEAARSMLQDHIRKNIAEHEVHKPKPTKKAKAR